MGLIYVRQARTTTFRTKHMLGTSGPKSRTAYGSVQAFFVSMYMNPVRDKKRWYTYVLLSLKDGKWYTGSTGDLRKRLRQHADGQNVSTKHRGPFELIYYEMCCNEEDARAREIYLKSGMGKRYLRNRLKRFLSLTG